MIAGLSLVLFLVAACGPVATPAPFEPLPTTAPSTGFPPEISGDVRERIVQALDRPGFVARVQMTIASFPEQEEPETLVAWVDVANRRARRESIQDERVANVVVVTPNSAATYDRSINRFEEISVSSVLLPPELAESLPPLLNNPALSGMVFLQMPLIHGDWRRSVGWSSVRLSGWDVTIDDPRVAMPGPVGAQVFLDRDTDVPVSLILGFPNEEGAPAENQFNVSYEVEFVGLGAVPSDFFDIDSLLAMALDYDGKLDDAESMEFATVWLGKEIDLGLDYPALELKNVGLGQREFVESFARFGYESSSDEDAVNKVEVTVWQREIWETQVVPNWSPNLWWRDPELSLQSIDVHGVAGEYAIGHPPGPQSVTPSEIRLWLPDSFVLITARVDPPPPEPSVSQYDVPSKANLVAATPVAPGVTEPSVFGTEEALVNLVRALRLLE